MLEVTRGPVIRFFYLRKYVLIFFREKMVREIFLQLLRKLIPLLNRRAFLILISNNNKFLLEFSTTYN